VFRNILVAIDGSASAAQALEEAIELARRDGARLVLLAVAAPPRWRLAGAPSVPYPSDADLEHMAWDVVHRAEALVPPDVAVCSIVRVGSPAAAIVTRAEQGGHDLVVMGSRGHGFLSSLLLGSVSRAVVAHSSVPVVVAGRPPEQRSLPQRPTPRDTSIGHSRAVETAHPEPATKDLTAVLLWLVAALLLELELAWWIFNRTYGP
jgi:nucleotide-binding universal stress UspA family protein